MAEPLRKIEASSAGESPKAWLASYEGIRALNASLPELGEDPRNPEAWNDLVESLIRALERAHRNLIQRNTQLAGLRDLTDRLLVSADTRSVGRLFVRYLQRGYGLREVVLALEEGALGVRVFWSGGSDPDPAQGEVLWSRAEVEGSDLGRLFWGGPASPRHGRATDGPDETPPRPDRFRGDRYDAFIPLPSGRSAGPSHLGILAAKIDPSGGHDGALLLELEGVAYSLASCVENQKLQREIQKSQRLREDLFRNLGHALCAVDNEGRVLACNESASRWSGIDDREVVGTSLDDLPRALAPMTLRLRSALTQSKDLPAWEAEMTGPDGTVRPVSVTANLLRDEAGHPYGAMAVAADLSDIKAMEQRIRQLDRLAVVGRFTSAIAHEIKNPLTGIAAGVEFLRRSFAEDAAEQKDIQFLLDEIERLNRIIQDLFDLANPRGLNMEEVWLEEVLAESAESVRHELSERGVSLAADVLPARITADRDRLRQVFINLFKNAAEASPPSGSIVVEAESAAGDVRISVRDQGEGMTAEQLEHLFEPFYTTKKGGTGLGLYVCYGIIQRHGGRLEVMSRHGKGSVFTITLPRFKEAQGEETR